MNKKVIYSLLAIFLFVFISVTFLIPSDLNAETRKFWVDTSHWETEKEWVDTSHLKIEGHWENKKEWVDTSHWVYQGNWKNSTNKVWVDTSHWVSSGHWEPVAERVWVKSGYTTYRNVKKWIDTSHYETRSYSVWVKSGYTASRWVDTSHWVTRYRYVRQAYKVWVRKSYVVWGIRFYYWKWETRYRYVRQAYRVYVKSGYWSKRWVDTSHWKTIYYKVWVKSGYWTTVREAYYIDTSHWEDQKVWVAGHYETRYRYVEDWQPCDKTFTKSTEYDKWWKLEWLWGTTERDQGTFKGKIYGTMYKYHKIYIYYGQFGFWDDLDVNYPDDPLTNYEIARPFKIRYECYEVLNGYKKEAYSEWVPPDYQKKWVDTSHLVKSGYWQYDTYSSWVDTSYLKNEGHWETEKVWVDTSHWEETGYWKNNDVWVEDGFYTSPLHGEVIVKKSPKYIFTRWHKDQNNRECSMELNVSWKVDNSSLSEGEEEKEIVRIYIYQDICRYDNKGVEKVTIFNGNITPSVEGSINTITKFDYSGNEESILHIYLYAQNGESAHVYFNNPINGFRSINLMSEGSSSDANTWLGGNNYVKFEF